MGDLYKSRLNNSLHHSSYRPGDRVVLEVRFPTGDKTYCYDADPGIYYPGDKVFVNVNDGYKDVTVVKAYYFDNHEYPFYTLPLKSIAGRANDTDYSYSRGEYFNVKVEVKGNVIKVYVDDELLFEYIDSLAFTYGKVGIYLNDADVNFKNIAFNNK